MSKLSSFAEFDETPQLSLEVSVDPPKPTIDFKLVPNKFPSIKVPNRIAIIGEAPGSDEVHAGEPFVGISGRFLNQLLSKLGILRDACFVGNVMQIRPPMLGKKQLSPIQKWSKSDLGNIEHLRLPALNYGLDALRKDLDTFKPNVVVLLGKSALWAAMGETNLGDWRGSVFTTVWSESGGIGQGLKCIASYHPAACLRNYSFTPLLSFDLKKALQESKFPDLRPPKRDLVVNLSFDALCHELNQILSQKPLVSCDIEGGVSNMSCISFATSASRAVILPFTRLDGESYWTIDEETHLWRLLSSIMADDGIRKVWQNGLYDRFVLQYGYSILVRNSAEDTMIKWWELYCELEKALAVQCSILTDEPFYKFNRKTEDQETFYKYCCTDSAVTFEICDKLTPCLNVGQREHYRFNIDCLNILLYAEIRGIRYNEPLAKFRLEQMQSHVYATQEKLDEEARKLGALQGINFDTSNADILAQVQKICGKKADPTSPKKTYVDDGYWEIIQCLVASSAEPLSIENRARISSLCGCTMNTKGGQFKDFLYKTCGLPTQWKVDPQTKELRITTDYEALLKLSKTHDHPVLKIALDLSLFRTRVQMLSVKTVRGRIHCSYNLVGSETGRVTSSKSMIYV